MSNESEELNSRYPQRVFSIYKSTFMDFESPRCTVCFNICIPEECFFYREIQWEWKQRPKSTARQLVHGFMWNPICSSCKDQNLVPCPECSHLRPVSDHISEPNVYHLIQQHPCEKMDHDVPVWEFE